MKHKYKTTLFKKRAIITLCLIIALSIATTAFITIYNAKPSATLALNDFPADTKISYKILADGQIIENQTKKIQNQTLTLPVPDTKGAHDPKSVSYHLQIEQEQNPAQTLNLLLALEKETEAVKLSAHGTNKFSNILVSDGQKQAKINADWAGILKHENLQSILKKDNESPDTENIELAFSNIGSARDHNLNMGTIDIQFGSFFGEDSNQVNRDAVRARYNWALRKMTQQLSAVIALQTEIIGMFFDSSIQIQTQRKHQELRAQAHKDYHPSEQMCRIGTFVRNIANAESKINVNKQALNKALMNEYLGANNSAASQGVQLHSLAKSEHYRKYYCDPRDNNAALSTLCPSTGKSGTSLDRLNKDINYTKTLDSKLTLDIDFSNGSASNDETDIIALAKNLYMPEIFALPLEENVESNPVPQFNARAFAAKMNVAHNSFVNIVGMKSKAPTSTIGSKNTGGAHMKAMLREFGITDDNKNGSIDDEINMLLGANPSYYAQMDVLTKKLYQHPNFYTNLYDKPVNVDRIGASLDAIAIMHQRDRFESLLRREMLSAILIEESLGKEAESINASIARLSQRTQR